jgi:putative glutamine amidotransferase
MKIAITQRQLSINGIAYDCLEQGWYRLLSDHEIVPVPNISRFDIDADMLILSGGNSSEDRYRTELACCRWADDNNIPVLGVCHGAFFLNFVYNGVNHSIEQHQNTQHDIIMDGEIYNVNSYHTMGIYELSTDLEAIAYAKDDIEAFKHKTKDIWGLVWHPERMAVPVLPTDLKELLLG